MHKVSSALLAAMLLAGMALPTGVAWAEGAAPVPPNLSAASPPVILLDGLPLPFPVPPTIIRDRTMVPFRAIAEALGVTVTWHADTRSIEAVGPGREATLGIGQTVARVNGLPLSLDVPPLIVSDRTLVPLRFFSNAFGATVDWDEATRTVSIRSPVRPLRTLAFYAIQSYGERALVGRFTDAAYGWSVLLPDGRVDLAGGPDYRWPEPAGDVTGERLLTEAAASHTRRHLMVHARDEKGDFTGLVLDPALSAKAAGEIAAAVLSKNFDGVVLDLEYLGQTEQGEDLERVRQGYARLVQLLAARLRPAGKEIIISVHPLNGAFAGYDYKALAASADLLQVMAHDYLDRRTDTRPEPAAQVIEAVELALKEAPRDKLLLGIVAPYETAETLAQKAGLAKRYGLRGLSVWRLGTVGPERMAALETAVRPAK